MNFGVCVFADVAFMRVYLQVRIFKLNRKILNDLRGARSVLVLVLKYGLVSDTNCFEGLPSGLFELFGLESFLHILLCLEKEKVAHLFKQVVNFLVVGL
jgi:hypothetical protein